MTDEQLEPGELTQRFRVFSESVDPEPSRALPLALLVGLAGALLALITVVWILFAR